MALLVIIILIFILFGIACIVSKDDLMKPIGLLVIILSLFFFFIIWLW